MIAERAWCSLVGCCELCSLISPTLLLAAQLELGKLSWDPGNRVPQIRTSFSPLHLQPLQSQELGLMILMSPFQLRIFSEYGKEEPMDPFVGMGSALPLTPPCLKCSVKLQVMRWELGHNRPCGWLGKLTGLNLIDTRSLGICPNLRILECFPLPCTFVLPHFCISVKVERDRSTAEGREEHLLVGNFPTLPVTIIITRVMTISPIFMVSKSFSRKPG